MIEYGITNEWNVQMRTSKHNCDHWVVTMETLWLPWQPLKDEKLLRNVVARDISGYTPTKSAKLTSYTTSS